MGLSTIDRRTFGWSRRAAAIDLAVIAAAILILYAHPGAGWIERTYSGRWYPAIEHALAPFAAAVPFAVGDLLAIPLLAITAWAIVRVVRARNRGARLFAGLGVILRLAAVGAIVAVWFRAAWALNYERIPLATKLDFQTGRITAAELERLTTRVAYGLNLTYTAAHATPERSGPELATTIEPSFREVIARLGNAGPFAGSPPKATVFNPYLASTAITGYTNPFTYEVVLERHLSAFERPFVLAHEWGHLAGFASETAANFIAALTCTRSPDPAVRYSGWLGISFYLPAGEAARLPIDAGVAADIAAIRRGYAERIDRRLFALQWQSYGNYLKANGVANGTASYGAFVDLLVGSAFDERGLPKRRALAGG